MAIRQRTRSARLLVVTLVAASLAIITVDYRAGEEGPLAAAGRAASSAIAPMQRAVSNVVQPVSNFFGSLADLPSLSRRNGDLRRQVDDLKTVQQLNQELTRRIDTLERLLGLQTIMSRTVAARVIGSGVSNFEWTITIDRGSDEGIALDMPVVTGASDGPRLVGRVVQVTPISSMVQLIIDRDFAVAGRLSTSHEAGIVVGRGEEDLRMDLLAPGIQVSETEPESVFTMGYEVNGQPGLYPAGILIGTVSRAFSEPDAVESSVTIRPAVDFSTLQYVLVIARDRSPQGAP
ncbi:MAG TPA: rod shape-determining protein MreC [Actinomycetota bacterium]|nr:rod shape-determining protein MreC [Actinomycetota bacterium]